jgi:hypothetical protein
MASAGPEAAVGTAAGGAIGARAVFWAAEDDDVMDGMAMAPVFSGDVPTESTSLVVWDWQPARVARRPKKTRPAGKRMKIVTLYYETFDPPCRIGDAGMTDLLTKFYRKKLNRIFTTRGKVSHGDDKSGA